MRGNRQCIGFGRYEANCDAASDLTLNSSGLWCTRCERLRRTHISAQMEKVTAGFDAAETRPVAAEATTTKPGGSAAPSQEVSGG